ncbi:MAG TPA: hypothetical protein VGB73_11420 [Pyrinomonadaceae bacterium]|jgi:hypothetical protein
MSGQAPATAGVAAWPCSGVERAAAQPECRPDSSGLDIYSDRFVLVGVEGLTLQNRRHSQS